MATHLVQVDERMYTTFPRAPTQQSNYFSAGTASGCYCKLLRIKDSGNHGCQPELRGDVSHSVRMKWCCGNSQYIFIDCHRFAASNKDHCSRQQLKTRRTALLSCSVREILETRIGRKGCAYDSRGMSSVGGYMNRTTCPYIPMI